LLVQTDTTVGFVSQNASALARCKNRPSDKPFLKTFASLGDYKRSGRIPERFKRELRRTAKTTYIAKGRAFRIVPDGEYHRLLKPYGWLYSTSANAAGERFEPSFAYDKADIIIEDARGLYEDVPSNIYKINKQIKRRIR
jgi:tRNA A37 threonylcarbamoyladenosine synthetase subunit TsaC/SUA5/YrdC